MRYLLGVAAFVLGVISVQSCGVPASSDAAKPADSSGQSKQESPTDVQKPFSIALDTASAEIPGGALPDGAKMSMAAGTTPESFTTASAETASASKPVAFTAVAADGSTITVLQAPMTIALKIDDSMALTGVDKTPDNLCAFAAAADGALLVWRRTAFTSYDEASKVAKLKSLWLGTFQLFYCGTTALAGFKEVDSTGSAAIAANIALHGVCDASTVTGSEGATCVAYSGKYWGEQAEALKKNCAEVKGTFTATGACPELNRLGFCIYNSGTAGEQAASMYAAEGKTAATAQASCIKNESATWATAFAVTPDESQAAYTAPQESSSVAQVDSMKSYACVRDNGSCSLYTGTYYLETKSFQDETKDACVAESGSHFAAVCSGDATIGICVTKQGTDRESGEGYYEGFSDPLTPQEKCEGKYFPTGDVWHVGTTFTGTEPASQTHYTDPSGTIAAKTAPACAQPTYGACRAPNGACAEYRGSFYANAGEAEAACRAEAESALQHRDFLPDGCPAAGAVGCCIKENISSHKEIDFAYYAPFDDTDANSHCSDSSTGVESQPGTYTSKSATLR